MVNSLKSMRMGPKFLSHSENKINYVTHDLEFVAIVHYLKMWRHFLLGRRFVLMTDHSGLRYLFDQPNSMLDKQGGWLSSVSLIFKSNILKEKKWGWMMPLVEV
jgi:hypothetical protein